MLSEMGAKTYLIHPKTGEEALFFTTARDWLDMDSKLIAQWKQEEQMPFKGWDFSYLKGRLLIEKTPWNYASLAKRLIQTATSMLDMGTGGGEKLSTFGPFPKITVATEGYAPNIPVAKQRLESLGITVVGVTKENPLPFPNETFDLVLNRHESFNAKEVYRILKSRGMFLTQQVGGDDLQDLTAFFGTKRKYNIRLQPSRDALSEAGFIIKEAEEWKGDIEFKDILALVYYLKAIPWIVQNFSVDKYLQQLITLQQQLDAGKPLVFTQSRFYILAQKS